MNNNGRTIVYLATKTNAVDNGIYRIIKNNHGSNTRIKIVRSSRVFSTDKGLTTLIQQNSNTGLVYAIKSDFTDRAFETAAQTGLPFGLLFKNRKQQWESFRVRAEKTQRKETVGTDA